MAPTAFIPTIIAIPTRQPVNCPRSWVLKEQLKTRVSKWSARIPARLLVGIKRYHCGMTVGHGWYKDYAGTTPASTECDVIGIFEDGTIVVALGAATFRLRKEWVEVTDWSRASSVVRELYDTAGAQWKGAVYDKNDEDIVFEQKAV